MRIDRVRGKNFKYLANVALRLPPGAVIVGENCGGKRNLLCAWRLVLDPLSLAMTVICRVRTLGWVVRWQ
jgi:predicted ATPase